VKTAIVNPLANYLPSRMTKAILRATKSELAAANWADPGGWRSMVISYEGRPRKLADRVLVKGGSMPMALRNRRRLAARVLADLIDGCAREPVHVLCLGAGPGHIITDAMLHARRRSRATLVDLSGEAFEYGRRLAAHKGLADRVRYVQGDVRRVREVLDSPPDVVKMVGICEYLSDSQISDIAAAVAAVMAAGAAVVFNSLSRAHGTDRFFRRVLGLHMNYRSPEDLMRMMRLAGFGDFVSHPEPLGVYHVVMGRRAR
jgi:predicted RNA methylase